MLIVRTGGGGNSRDNTCNVKIGGYESLLASWGRRWNAGVRGNELEVALRDVAPRSMCSVEIAMANSRMKVVPKHLHGLVVQ